MLKTVNRMLRTFAEINKKICNKLRILRLCRTDMFAYYDEAIRGLIKDGQTVADIGGGKTGPAAALKSEFNGIKIIAVDISEDELRSNEHADEKIVADVTRHIPLPAESVDIMVSRTVLEHLKTPGDFFKNAYPIIKRNGYFIHLFPSKFSLFAVLNQLLPSKLSSKLITFFFPGRGATGVFPSFYNDCRYPNIIKLLHKHGYQVDDIKISYYQSDYFGIFVPAYIFSLIWDNICCLLKLKPLGAYICVIARKP
jgi:ubiquinone/menaquinone biosynthesis C-methylase UbiE